jgi:ABC-type transport system involved in multi-copper enzyme maturation permease subunit
MSTLAPAHRIDARPQLRVTQTRVIRSEWIKFWSLRSTTVTLIAAVVVYVGIGLLASSVAADGGFGPGQGPGGDGAAMSPTDYSLAGSTFGMLVLGTLGVLLMAGEYSTGMIRSTLGAVPRRLPVLAAKATVFTAVVFPIMLAASFVAFLAGQAIIGAGGASLSDDGVLRAVIGSAVYLTGAGLLGLMLGALLRSTPAAISTLFGVMFLLEGVTQILLPDSWRDTIGPYLPSSAGAAFGAVTRQADSLGPWAGLAVFLAYIVALGAAAAWRLKRQDA